MFQRIYVAALAFFAFAETAISEEFDWLNFPQTNFHYTEGRNELVQGMNLMRSDSDSARSLFEESKALGNPLGHLMCSRFTESHEERVKLLRFAKEKRVQLAVYMLGDALYRHGQGAESDRKEALELFLQAAEWNNKDAAFYAGRMYHFGHGTEKDYEKARDFYQRAVDNGSIRAANNLANLHGDGLGGPKSMSRYLDLMQYASENGMAMASYNLGLYHLDDAENAPDWHAAEPYFELAWEQADGDYPRVAYQLGRIAQFNYTGGGEDFEKAAEYYSLAAEHSDRAAFHLGRFYRDGVGVQQDIQKALHYFELSAEDENSRAIFAIGWLYDSGQLGVPDYKTAISYYQQAEVLGHAQAKANLGWIYWEEESETKQAEIHRLHREAIEQDNIIAISNYGYLNLYEKLEQTDPVLGLKLTLRAAEAGERPAVENLMYYYEGWGELREPAPEQAAYWRKRLAEL